MSNLSLPDRPELWQSTLGWQPTAAQYQQFQHLYDLVLTSNQSLNLTRITEPDDFWEKHLWDSLRGIQPYLAPDQVADHQPFRVLDIGTGAGFPGIPVAIARPDWQVTLLDSTRKKIAAVADIVAALGLPNVTTIADRAEYLGIQPAHQATYDQVLLRAVGTAEQCVTYALPLLKPGGMAILYRGQWQDSDTDSLGPLVDALGGHLAPPNPFTTPLSHSQRCCLTIQRMEAPRSLPIPN